MARKRSIVDIPSRDVPEEIEKGTEEVGGRNPSGSASGGPSPSTFEQALAAEGCDVEAAKEALRALKRPFPTGAPESVLAQWAAQYVPVSALNRAVLTLARQWEKE